MSVAREPQVIGYRGGGLEGHAPFTEDAPRPPVPGEEGGGGGGSMTPPTHGRLPLSSLSSLSSSSSYYHSSSKAELHRLDPSALPHPPPSSSSAATPRRPDLDLGYEPEGSASPTPPYLKWAESLHSLLDDQEGTQLFRSFLRQEGCGDLLDFWFACSGFRKTANQEKRPKLAKAIYRKYVAEGGGGGGGMVSRQIKPATKSFIRDGVLRLAHDPAMFEQAQTEIQTTMEENTYPLFLKSDLYLEYTRTGGESPKPPGDQGSSSGVAKPAPGYLPTLTEDVEWRQGQGAEEEEEEEEEDEECGGRLTQRLLMDSAPLRSSIRARAQESMDYRPWREPVVNPYYVNVGYNRAPATSANDSEQQSMSSASDHDTLSLPDSSVDGIPPYRYRKHHRREMHESAKANGRVPLPHIPRTYRMPKDVHVQPERFATELIARLETVQRERDAQDRLEERLHRVRLEEEGDDADVSMATSSVGRASSCSSSLLAPSLYGARYSDTPALPLPLLPHYGHAHPVAPDDDAEAILDEHVQRVMKTPGCQSPGATTSRSPDGGPGGAGVGGYPRGQMGQMGQMVAGGGGSRGHKTGKTGDAAGMGTGVYHHKHSYHAPPVGGARPAEEAGPRGPFVWNGDAHHYAGKGRNYADGTMEGMPGYGSKGSTLSKRSFKKAESTGKAEEGRGLEGRGPEGRGLEGRGLEAPVPLDDLERNQKILQWMMEGEALRHKKSTHGSSVGSSSRKTHPGGGAGSIDPSSLRKPHPVGGGASAAGGGGGEPSLGAWPGEQQRAPGGGASSWLRPLGPAPPQPSHPFVQDPAMPPNPAPNPLTQLEEARRRLEEERRRSLIIQQKQRHKSAKRPANENVTVAYYFCGEPIPYRTSVRGRVVTLGQFKELLTKKGCYRFYFKKVSDEFDCGVVFEEVREDDAILPIFEEKIIGKVEKVD